MNTFRSIILIALLVGQATAFMTAGKTSKSVTSLESYYNRNYDSVGGYGGNDRYMDQRGMGQRGGMRYNEYDRGYNNRYGPNDYNRGGYRGDYNYNSYDRGYGYGGRSKMGDWLNGSSNYIPTSADRNYVMNRNYETGIGGRYNNYYYNGDRYNDRFNNYGPMQGNMAPRGRMNDYTRGGYNGYDRYSPVGYNNNRAGSYNREYNPRYERNFQGGEYERTYRSPMDSHRQEYPSYSMGRMEDQFGNRKWWDGN
jgi:hypothetical protein